MGLEGGAEEERGVDQSCGFWRGTLGGGELSPTLPHRVGVVWPAAQTSLSLPPPSSPLLVPALGEKRPLRPLGENLECGTASLSKADAESSFPREPRKPAQLSKGAWKMSPGERWQR